MKWQWSAHPLPNGGVIRYQLNALINDKLDRAEYSRVLHAPYWLILSLQDVGPLAILFGKHYDPIKIEDRSFFSSP